MNRAWITLLTDFGWQDTFVGQMKGVIAGINPDATVIDLTHDIAPQDIRQAARTLSDACPAFPTGTIHVIVVDPGVGSQRRALAAEIDGHRFVCPDNGLLTPLLRRATVFRCVTLNQPRWWRTTVSGTFHGRDVFAPVAAAWSLGLDLLQFGSPLDQPVCLPDAPGPRCETGPMGLGIHGTVIDLDHFGNLITDLRAEHLVTLPTVGSIQLEARPVTSGLCHCYAERQPGAPVALINSSGWLEIAVVNGNAAQTLHAGRGSRVTVFARKLT